MALKVLMADIDPAWVKEKKSFLEDQAYLVDTVQTGKEVQLSLYNQKYFAVILNAQIQDHSGLQVLKFLRKAHSSVKVILIMDSEYAENFDEERDELIKQYPPGACLTKPVADEQLTEALEGQKNYTDIVRGLKRSNSVQDEVEVKDKEENYTQININEFYGTKAVLFDVFVKLGNGHFVKILHAGDNFSRDRIDHYKNEKKVTHLYFHGKDRKKFIQSQNFLAGKAVKSEKIHTSAKVNLLKNVVGKFEEEYNLEGIKPQVIEQGKEIVENIYQVIEQEKNLHSILKDFNAFDPEAFSHAYLVTLFAGAMVKQFEWQSRATIQTISFACMFHDIGKMELPKELVGKSEYDMSEEELGEYRKHSTLSVEILAKQHNVSNSVRQIIAQHHEHIDGTGFPLGVKGQKILVLGNILCLADRYVHIIQEKELHPIEAARNLLASKEADSWFHRSVITNFAKIFTSGQVPVPEENAESQEAQGA